jgi:5-methylcytosine-specific restriction protein B
VDYPPRPGAFVRFCRRAERIDGPCVFVIDEINRGNISRIFGELLLLLEYRDEAIPLPYSGDRFRIPANVHLIGTMNTADRSIALVDFALRRRFHFFRFSADPDLFDRWLARHPAAPPYLGALYRRLATEAVDDPDYAIGPSVFMRDLDEAGLARLWRRSIMPYLEEYYLDQRTRAQLWAWEGDLVRSLRAHGEEG